MMSQGGTAPPLALPELDPHWITGNAYKSGEAMNNTMRHFYNNMKHHKWGFNRACVLNILNLFERTRSKFLYIS